MAPATQIGDHKFSYRDGQLYLRLCKKEFPRVPSEILDALTRTSTPEPQSFTTISGKVIIVSMQPENVSSPKKRKTSKKSPGSDAPEYYFLSRKFLTAQVLHYGLTPVYSRANKDEEREVLRAALNTENGLKVPECIVEAEKRLQKSWIEQQNGGKQQASVEARRNNPGTSQSTQRQAHNSSLVYFKEPMNPRGHTLSRDRQRQSMLVSRPTSPHSRPQSAGSDSTEDAGPAKKTKTHHSHSDLMSESSISEISEISARSRRVSFSTPAPVRTRLTEPLVLQDARIHELTSSQTRVVLDMLVNELPVAQELFSAKLAEFHRQQITRSRSRESLTRSVSGAYGHTRSGSSMHDEFGCHNPAKDISDLDLFDYLDYQYSPPRKTPSPLPC